MKRGERLPICGEVVEILYPFWVFTFLHRLIYVAIGTWAVYDMLHTTWMAEKTVDMMVLLYMAWQVGHSGQWVSLLGTEGILFPLRPNSLRAYIDAEIRHKPIYMALPYEDISGITPDWRFLHQQHKGGLITVVPIMWGTLSKRDKKYLIRAIKAGKLPPYEHKEED